MVIWVAMETKKCCYMDRACTPACVAYSVSNEMSNGAEEIGLSDMHCSRMFFEFANFMYNNTPFDVTDLEDEEDF
jgi:hypothetical protein